MFNSAPIEQLQPKNSDSRRRLKDLQLYLHVFCAWFIIKVIFKSKSVFGSIYCGFLLFNGIKKLSASNLSLFVVMKLFSVLSYISLIDEYSAGKLKPEFQILCLSSLDILISLWGIRVCFKGYQCFKAEAMGFLDQRDFGGGIMETQEQAGI